MIHKNVKTVANSLNINPNLSVIFRIWLIFNHKKPQRIIRFIFEDFFFAE